MLLQFELITFDLLMGEPQNHHFYEFGIFGRVSEPQNHLFLSLETPRDLNKIKKNPGAFFKYIIFINIRIMGIHNFVNFGKDGRRKFPTIRLIKS